MWVDISRYKISSRLDSRFFIKAQTRHVILEFSNVNLNVMWWSYYTFITLSKTLYWKYYGVFVFFFQTFFSSIVPFGQSHMGSGHHCPHWLRVSLSLLVLKNIQNLFLWYFQKQDYSYNIKFKYFEFFSVFSENIQNTRKTCLNKNLEKLKTPKTQNKKYHKKLSIVKIQKK